MESNTENRTIDDDQVLSLVLPLLIMIFFISVLSFLRAFHSDCALVLPGKKKSRFKLLKSRLFSHLKRKENHALMKPSQSAGDVGTRGGGEGFSDSEEDCL